MQRTLFDHVGGEGVCRDCGDDTDLDGVCRQPDITAGRHGGNAESLAAHARLAPKLPRARAAILAEIQRQGKATLESVCEALGLLPHKVSGRIAELLRDRLIRDCGERRANRGGNQCRVVVPAGV